MKVHWYMARFAFYAAAWLVATTAVVAGIALLLAALWLVVGETHPPAIAALWTGLAALAVGASIVAAAYGIRGRRASAGGLLASLVEWTESGREQDVAAKLGALVGREAVSLIGAHPGRAAVTALAAGFVIGANPRLREALRELLK